MKKMINHWHFVSVYLAGAAALVAILVPMNITPRLLWASISILFLHFYEEFGAPGGFPYMGMKVLMGSSETDKTKWSCNNLSSMFGNWGFLFLLYVVPLLLPDVRFLTLSAMLFLFAEVIMYLLLFPVRMKEFYNPGQITGVLGLGIIGIYYFTIVFEPQMYLWYDYVLAIAWFVGVFWFSFRSPLYWGLGAKPGFDLTDKSAFGLWEKVVRKQ